VRPRFERGASAHERASHPGSADGAMASSSERLRASARSRVVSSSTPPMSSWISARFEILEE
jgi:hypothetical protein